MMRSGAGRVAVAMTALAVAAVLSGCAAEPLAATTSPTSTALPAPVGDERGRIVSAVLLGQVDAGVRFLGATATRVVYRTTAAFGEGGVDVSGVVFAPKGEPPPGGWPVVTVGHGTTGVTDECAPSLYPNLLGTIGLVTPFLERGFVVAVTDYQGLGMPGVNPYLDRDSAAYDVIDAVRAARYVVPGTSTRWGAIGNSQGGQAVWSAAEHVGDYGDGLEAVGTAALSPAANLTGMYDADRDATLPQILLAPFLARGLAASDPSADIADYQRGSLAENLTDLTACTDLLGIRKAEAGASVSAADAVPATDAARAAMVRWLESVSVPTMRSGIPMLVVVGEQDDLVDPQWTDAAVQRACASGETVELRVRPGQGHSDLGATADGVDWLTQRFAGAPAADTCAPGDGR